MKKKLIILISLLVLILLSHIHIARSIFIIQWWYLSNYAGHDGLYNSYLDEYYCTTETSCLHEQGHSEDNLLEWYSETEAFLYTLEVLADCKISKLSELPLIQYVLRSSKITDAGEIYATIYSIVDLKEHNTLKDLMTNYATQCI